MRYKIFLKLAFLQLAIALIFIGPVQAFSQQRSTSDETEQATLYETLGDIKAFSKRIDNASGDMDRTDAIVDLGSLYLRVVGDSRFSRSKILQGYRGRIGIRLQKARTLIEREQKKAAASKDESRYVTRTEEQSEDDRLESAVVDKQWQLVAHVVGGTAPSMYYGSGLYGTSGHFYRGRVGGLLQDNGDELLNLIRTVLFPDFWQINGGSGRAYYYQPLRIIVIRATMRVHEDLTNLLERLR